MTSTIPWEPESICLRPMVMDASAIAFSIYSRTCRTNLDAPGFCVVNFGNELDSVSFRQWMVELKREMAAIHEARTGHTLVYLSALRVDQQETTKPHLDGGPDECLLMLGYEPTEIPAVLELSDYSRCARDLGLSPKEFMARHNPMFQAGAEMLRPYTTKIPCFSPAEYQIVCINNSTADYSEGGNTWQGVLHTATILAPDESKRRVINSTMIASMPLGSLEVVDKESLQNFIHTSEVKRRGYDKLHLQDD